MATNPKKPRKPIEPTPPSKRIKRSDERELGCETTVDALLRALPPDIPVSEILVCMRDGYDYDSVISITWNVEVDNPNYDTEYVKYLERMKLFAEATKTYEERLKVWEAEEATRKLATNTRIQQLEAELAALRSKG